MPSKATRKTAARGKKPERVDVTPLFKEESKPAWKPDSIESHRARMDRINLEILKLLSERASYLTGAAIPVDGGATARCYAYPIIEVPPDS